MRLKPSSTRYCSSGGVWAGAAGTQEAALGNDNRKKVHLLDDGFQHRRLARAMDVVVETEADLEDALLPAGDRREALRALRLADAVVVHLLALRHLLLLGALLLHLLALRHLLLLGAL